MLPAPVRYPIILIGDDPTYYIFHSKYTIFLDCQDTNIGTYRKSEPDKGKFEFKTKLERFPNSERAILAFKMHCAHWSMNNV